MANINGTSGKDTLNGTVENDSSQDFLFEDLYTLMGLGFEVGNEQLYGEEGDDVLLGHGGDDLLDGGAGADLMKGGAGNDTYYIDDAHDAVKDVRGGGHDTVYSSADIKLDRHVEDIVLQGTGSINATGNNLDNFIIASNGSNAINGGRGNDTVSYENAAGGVQVNLQIRGAQDTGAGIDKLTDIENLIGTGFNDALTGNWMDNRLDGGSGGDILDGRGGNDILDGGTGHDIMTGGDGNDTYVVDDALDIVLEKNAAGTDSVMSSISYVLGDTLENLILTGTGDLDGTGNGSNNVLIGNDGDNILDGRGGADFMQGGKGDDSYVIDHAGDQIVELDGEGTDQVFSYLTWVLGSPFENLALMGSGNINGTGNALDNIIIGNDGNNVLDGNGGADYMQGGLGNDTYMVDNAGDVVVEGAAGGTDLVKSSVSFTLDDHTENLTLTGTGNINGTGNELDNVITGNSGSNILDGGLGNDTLNGGAGRDIFVFNTTLGNGNVDTIIGFNVADDTIRLDDAIFAKLAGGMTADNFVANAAGKAMDANDYLVYDSDSGSLYYDADGNGAGAAVLFATFDNHAALTAAGFVIV